MGSPVLVVVLMLYRIQKSPNRKEEAHVLPSLLFKKIIKNGSILNGKQKYLCRGCGRQFVENPANRPVSGERKS